VEAAEIAGTMKIVALGDRDPTYLTHREIDATLELLAPQVGPVAQKSVRRILREGFAVGVTNPKAVIFFTAIAPQFLDRSRGHAPLQLLTLGLIFIGIALVSDGAWGLAAGTARMWLGRSRRRLELLNLGGGIVMVGLGIRLALTGRQG
jgi:threonine/homoserine/homoserine lactone efflux protein